LTTWLRWKKLALPELCKGKWTGKAKDELAATVTAATTLFNRLAYWVCWCILDSGGGRKAVKMIERFILLGWVST